MINLIDLFFLRELEREMLNPLHQHRQALLFSLTLISTQVTLKLIIFKELNKQINFLLLLFFFILNKY